MKLYNAWRSSASFRVRIALNLKGLLFEYVPVHLVKGEQFAQAFSSLNPSQLVPVLEHEGHALTQSLAIIEYLEEKYPQPPLLPHDPLERAYVRSVALAIACEIHPLNNLRVLNHLRDALKLDKSAIADWYRHWCDEGLAAFERQLADAATGRFCHGDLPTMADACLVPQIFNARRFETNVERYPTVMRIFDECMALEAFRKAEPSAQPEASRAD